MLGQDQRGRPRGFRDGDTGRPAEEDKGEEQEVPDCLSAKNHVSKEPRPLFVVNHEMFQGPPPWLPPVNPASTMGALLFHSGKRGWNESLGLLRKFFRHEIAARRV